MGPAVIADTSEKYFKGFPYFAEETADFLIKKQIKCLGVDIPSLDNPNLDPVFHKKILLAGIGVIESLINLRPLANKRLLFCAFPLAIEKGDGSPVRAVAVDGLI